MSTVVQIGQAWHGFHRTKHLVIFGDSYSSVMGDHNERPVPTSAVPLAVPFPGTQDGLWNEPGRPNWVGHLLTKYRAGPLFQPGTTHQDPTWSKRPLLVYDYAEGGAEVMDVADQISCFLKSRTQPSLTAPAQALFVVWVGINDCADCHPENVEPLFYHIESLYRAGARNFLFIDVPPIHRSPALTPCEDERQESVPYLMWNKMLRDSAKTFANAHRDATVMVCSSFHMFQTILDYPEGYGFHRKDAYQSQGNIWYDCLHPTSAMHEQIAYCICKFLAGIRPHPSATA
ncbi:carbohydrate esterase family 16 protein [Cylindrobasidium torrendii FP15055 ss-10]|uniref:Carbohydrate esterase family 16 protein n=1 Tax=Cylindrobasidium torrendii FP15055 ss-10 TaxID=1314674 RepID=A0A0D7B5M4_9AGAR|nr:carbohydrate esterase family 16 protein [Cylindrobasidium torrendii FP15055 ss-10]